MIRLTKSQVTRQAVMNRAHAIKAWCRDNAHRHTFGDCLKTAWLEASEGKAQYWGFSQDTQNELNSLDAKIEGELINAGFSRDGRAAEVIRVLEWRKAAILAGPISLPLAA